MTFKDWMWLGSINYKPGDESVEISKLKACWDAATVAERKRCAELLEGQRYMTLDPTRSYTAEETWQTVRSSVKHLVWLIRYTNGQ